MPLLLCPFWLRLVVNTQIQNTLKIWIIYLSDAVTLFTLDAIPDIFLAEKEYLIWKNFRAYSLSSFYKTLTGDQIFEMDSFLKYFCQNYNFAFDKSHSNDFLQVLEILPVKKGRWSAVKY